jgi:hypothetical protein
MPRHGPGSTLILPDPFPLSDPNGQWVHVPFSWQAPSGAGSNFVRSPWNKVNLGVEHMPEPASTVVWMAGGAFCLVLRRTARRRRLRSS